VYESVLIGHEDLGSICSGGRYDTLASDGKNTYPGVGLSIGVSRLVSRLLSKGIVTASRSVPTAVLVAVLDEEHRAASDRVAAALRARGIATDVAPSAAKFGKQIKFADRRGIPFVWFPEGTNQAGEFVAHQVKDIRSGEQVDADPNAWVPQDAADLTPTVFAQA
jgi:histidyl-tRNA synthetase